MMGVCMKSENVSRFEGDFIMFLHEFSLAILNLE